MSVCFIAVSPSVFMLYQYFSPVLVLLYKAVLTFAI